MRNTQGDLSYNAWRGVIGLLTHCENGRSVAEDWSSRRGESHEQTNWDTKYDTWSSGPTTCQFFQGTEDGHRCNGCPFKDKVTSPIQLGRKAPEPSVPEVAQPVETKTPIEVPEMPEGFAYEDGKLVRYREDKDGILRRLVLSNDLFYPIQRVALDTGAYQMAMRTHLPDRRIREFSIPTETIAAPLDLAKALRKHGEVGLCIGKDVNGEVANYVNDMLESLKRRAREVTTYTAFGWKNDYEEFLIGNRLYHKDGRITKPLLTGYAKSRAVAFPEPKGHVLDYAKAVDRVYNVNGMQPLQYAFCTMYGSLLVPFGADIYHGLLFALYGTTGKGKTSVAFAASYGFGDPEEMKVSKDATVNSRWAHFGAMHNLPVLMDEVTADAEALSKMCYTISDGREKGRLKGGGGNGIEMQDAETWDCHALLTTNKNLYGTLSLKKNDTEAEAMRLWQVNVDQFDLPVHKGDLVAQQLSVMKANSGVASEAFIKHLLANLDEVRMSVAKWRETMQTIVPENKYRFYHDHAACTLTAAEILRELGVIKFDISGLRSFAVSSMSDAVTTVKQLNVVAPEDAFNAMLNEFSKGIIVTRELRDGREARGIEEVKISGEPMGRWVQGTGDNDPKKNKYAERLFLQHKAVREWCFANRVEYKQMCDWLASRSALVSEEDKLTLGKGTNVVTGTMRCLTVDTSKLDMTVARVALEAIRGGGDGSLRPANS